MTFEEYWYRCCDFHQCDECDVTVDCAVDKAIAQSAWEASEKMKTEDAIKDKVVDDSYVRDWYISSVSKDDSPVWTDEHVDELCNDFWLIPKS